MRISGINIPEKLVLREGLRKIFGIGHTRALYICEKVGLDSGIRVKDVTPEQSKAIQEIIESEFKVGSELIQEKNRFILDAIHMQNYKGKRLLKGLPVNGQRTKSNSKTSRRKKINLGSGGKK